jgi:O-antigen/teichoic acid export membrane protein
VRDVLTALAARFGIDRAVFYALLAHGWRACGGLVSILLIAEFLTPETQGYYYTFQSLVGLQVFFDLGLGLAVVSVTSHEWAKLRLNDEGALVGDPQSLSRLISFGRMLASWYAIIATVFVVIVAPGGAFFLSQKGNTAGWLVPWLLAVLFQGLLLWSLPFQALFEGCNQVVAIQRFQLWRSVLANLVLWICLSFGAGLWSLAAFIGMQAATALFYLGVLQRTFFLPFARPSSGSRIDWKLEVWPMQWRLALLGGVNFFMYSLFTPVMFHYYGAVMAGQMGMTWQVLSALQGAALAWLSTKVPSLGLLIAQKQYSELDRIWLRASLIGIIVMSLGGLAVWVFVYWLNKMELSLTSRLLSPLPTTLFVVATILMMVVQSLAIYLRAHKKEPLAVPGVISGLAIGTLVWLLGSRFGATGAALAYFLVLLIVTVPMTMMIWIRSRREWHKC